MASSALLAGLALFVFVIGVSLWVHTGHLFRAQSYSNCVQIESVRADQLRSLRLRDALLLSRTDLDPSVLAKIHQGYVQSEALFQPLEHGCRKP